MQTIFLTFYHYAWIYIFHAAEPIAIPLFSYTFIDILTESKNDPRALRRQGLSWNIQVAKGKAYTVRRVRKWKGQVGGDIAQDAILPFYRLLAPATSRAEADKGTLAHQHMNCSNLSPVFRLLHQIRTGGTEPQAGTPSRYVDDESSDEAEAAEPGYREEARNDAW